jgi:uncharacterized protein (TIGR03435 family)
LDWQKLVRYRGRASGDLAIEHWCRHSDSEIEDEHLREMLQALLIDQFQLKFHRETKTGPVYLLERSGKTVKLVPTKAGSTKHPIGGAGFSGDVGFAGGRWVLYNVSMEQLADFAGNLLHRPVLDRTGLDGSFDFEWDMGLTDPENRDYYAGLAFNGNFSQ